MGWEPIRRGSPEILGIDAADVARLDVRVPLDAEPPGPWAAFFLAPTRIRVDPGMTAPTLDGQAVRVLPRDGELPRYIAHVDERIAGANERYVQEVLPRVRVQQARDFDAVARREDRLLQARRAANGL